jgi:hypothetical protein
MSGTFLLIAVTIVGLGALLTRERFESAELRNQLKNAEYLDHVRGSLIGMYEEYRTCLASKHEGEWPLFVMTAKPADLCLTQRLQEYFPPGVRQDIFVSTSNLGRQTCVTVVGFHQSSLRTGECTIEPSYHQYVFGNGLSLQAVRIEHDTRSEPTEQIQGCDRSGIWKPITIDECERFMAQSIV